ncbi:fimbrial protein [Citrobacter braakii]
MRICFIKLVCFVFGVVSFSVLAISEQKGDSVDVKFTGLLQAMTPCSIDNDRTIEIIFGNVGINKVESGQYNREIDYDLDCGNVGDSNTILMTLNATPIPSDGSIVDSGRKGLWIQFYKDGVPLILNEEFRLANVTQKPKLSVSLIPNPGEVLEEGEFSVAVTLIAEYI